jgi:hypothetical protein
MNLRKAAEMALERLESHEYWMDEEAIQALRQALAESANSTTDFVEPKTVVQPEQEPVAWMTDDGFYELEPDGVDAVPLYTAPPKREWAGLVEQDVHDAFQFTDLVKQLSWERERPEWCENFAAYIEARLKEKNA